MNNMNNASRALILAVIAGAGLAAAGLVAAQDDPLPPGHPPVAAPTVPETEPAPPAARPDDVATIESVVAAYYASMSGPRGTPRDWERFRSLFTADARMATIVGEDAREAPLVLTPAAFARMNDRYFEVGGYSETSLLDRVERFGRIAHVRSTYAGRRGGGHATLTRGINSFQLMHTAGRWSIVSVVWERERPGAVLAPEHLPVPGSAGE